MLCEVIIAISVISIFLGALLAQKNTATGGAALVKTLGLKRVFETLFCFLKPFLFLNPLLHLPLALGSDCRSRWTHTERVHRPWLLRTANTEHCRASSKPVLGDPGKIFKLAASEYKILIPATFSLYLNSSWA